jgi:type I restriction enzyme R subunit
MTLHHEARFEEELCAHLGTHGWRYTPGDASRYDVPRALFPDDLTGWVQDTQPTAWAALIKKHGANAAEALATRVREQIVQRGTLDVLRHGVEMLGVRGTLQLAQFKPASGMNPDIVARYAHNRLRVVRQVRYSAHSERSLDLVLFLNGVAVATAELKTDFTQRAADAVLQYKEDRLPTDKGKAEPLLMFPSGAIVHFAVSTSEVYMTTRLAGKDTNFLPFNRGDRGGAGNPEDPSGGFRTAYLWEEVWERESWLDLIGRWLVARKDTKGHVAAVVFPRFHQLDATRRLLAAVLAAGPGGRYLIQHSAGSGKTNSIAWSAHFLSDLHDAAHRKLFDSVLVVSDRTVIDGQLAETVTAFQRTPGAVAKITGTGGSKSGELAAALAGGARVVVCTIQTFPFALRAVRELAATEGKRFAVIADEAHSSQTGEAAAKLKEVLSAEELAELDDGGEVSAEDLLAAQMASRTGDAGVTFVAFTATPKAKTLELFGTRPDPSRDPAADNLPAAFHVYSMRQAIEEGFILDVLQNYLSYKMAFKLAHGGEEIDSTSVDRSAAMKGILGWVRLHPYNIAQRVEIVVEHFRQLVAPLLGGRAKAMVVVSSRVEAVRWQLAIDAYIRERRYDIHTLVGFSGEVKDPESGPEPFTEASVRLNPNLRGRDLRTAFATEEYQILLVANKLQTGFDQPLLCGMYVDKRLAGIQAVQTLSRLNRAAEGKDTTYVLDFVNQPEEILAAFKVYYETATLSGVTNPNLVYDLAQKLDGTGHYTEAQVERVVKICLKDHPTQAELAGALAPVVGRLHQLYKEAKAAFKAAKQRGDEPAALAAQEAVDALVLFGRDMGTFVRLYTFLGQIYAYENTRLEKLALFFKHTLRLLDFGREREGVDLSRLVLTHHTLKKQAAQPLDLGEGEAAQLDPMTTGGGSIYQRQKVLLAQIIEQLNELFGAEVTDNDKLVYVTQVLMHKLLESDVLKAQATHNTSQQFAVSPDLDRALDDAILDAEDAHRAMSQAALSSAEVRRRLKELLLGPLGLWARLRE